MWSYNQLPKAFPTESAGQCKRTTHSNQRSDSEWKRQLTLNKASHEFDRSRPLTAQEEIYWRLTYTDQIHPVLAAEVKGCTTVEQWRTALDVVQRRHPLLRFAIQMPNADNQYTQPMFVPGQTESIPLRVEQGGGERSIEKEMERELATPFLAGEAPLARSVLLHEPERCVFILAISHSIADGISALLLIRDVLSVLAGQLLDLLTMPPSAEELLGVAPAVPPRAASEISKVSIYAGRKPTVMLRSLSVEATKKLSATARARGSTVHAALAAAFVQAMRQQESKFQFAPVRMISPVNTRAQLAAGDALGLYFSSPQSTFTPVEGTSFWDIASQARADISDGSSRDALLGATAAMQSLTKQSLSNDDAAALLKGAFAMDILLTNLGRIPYPSAFGKLSVETVWGPAVLGGLKVQAVGVATTNDRLCLTLTSRNPLPNLLETVTSILEDECSH